MQMTMDTGRHSEAYVYASEMELGLSPKSRGTDDNRRVELAGRQQPQGPALSDQWKESLRGQPHHYLQGEQSRMIAEASSLYFRDDFDGAAFLWERALFIARHLNAPTDVTATLCSNMGAAYHHLGEWDLANERYDEAIRSFVDLQASRGRLSRWMDGALTQRRIEFVRSRQELIHREERPPEGEYLDGQGTLRKDGRKAYAHTDSG